MQNKKGFNYLIFEISRVEVENTEIRKKISLKLGDGARSPILKLKQGLKPPIVL